MECPWACCLRPWRCGRTPAAIAKRYYRRIGYTVCQGYADILFPVRSLISQSPGLYRINILQHLCYPANPQKRNILILTLIICITHYTSNQFQRTLKPLTSLKMKRMTTGSLIFIRSDWIQLRRCRCFKYGLYTTVYNSRSG